MGDSVLLGPTGVDSNEEDAGRRVEPVGEQVEARQRRNGSTMFDAGDECLAQGTGQFELAQPERDSSPPDLGAEAARELGVRPERAVFSNS